MKNVCTVCGYDELFEQPYNENGIASVEICPCCGIHFGYDDFEVPDDIYIQWRTKWIMQGYPWFSRGRSAPPNWNPLEQVKKVL